MDRHDRSGRARTLLLVRRSADRVGRWLGGAIVATTVAPLGDWTGVTLAEDRTRGLAPYDVGAEVLAARPVPRALRPAVGFFDVRGRAVLTLHTGTVRARHRWLVWQPGIGAVATPHLMPLRMPELVRAIGSPADPADVSDILRSTEASPLDILVTVIEALGLPGRDLLVRGDIDGSRRILPTERNVMAFNRLVADEADARMVAGLDTATLPRKDQP